MKKNEKKQPDNPDRLNRLVEGAKVVGDLIVNSSLRIDGEVEGNISVAGKVVIGNTAKIKGNIKAGEADISGMVEGKIQVEKLLTLREKTKINGDIKTGKLHIEEGAKFDGTCMMSNSSSIPTSPSKSSDEVKTSHTPNTPDEQRR